MTPAIHLFGSWIIAAKTTTNARDCRLVTLAGILPDADGLGLVADFATKYVADTPTTWYEDYHHYLLHGLPGCIAITAILLFFARDRWRVAGLALLVFHLHLFCDLIGGRGPTLNDLWAIFYFGPLSKEPMWIWTGQWELNSWYNRLLAVVLFLWTLYLGIRQGQTFLGVFHQRLDTAVVAILQKWAHVINR